MPSTDSQGLHGSRVQLPAPHDVKRIARRLEEAGHETWAVGGAVRDALVGGVPGDWDLATAALPADVRSVFRRTVPVGIEHGTVGVLGKDGTLYEVTTFRRDVDTDGRHARVVFTRALEEDLARRDFTINAVAWHPLTGELRDPFGGIADLRRVVLRTVGIASERFREDRLRVLRAIRFAGRFGLQVEESTWNALCLASTELGILSAERVRDELWKTLSQGGCASDSLRLYAESGVLATLFPELQACVDAGIWSGIMQATDAVPAGRPLIRLAALFHRAAAPVSESGMQARSAAAARGALRRLRASNADTDRLVHLISHLGTLPGVEAPDPAVRRWLRRVGPEYIPDLVRLHVALCRAGSPLVGEDVAGEIRRVRAVLQSHPPLTTSDLAIGGAELRALGLPPGPRYREILDALVERVLADPLENTPDHLIAAVRESLGGSI